MIHPSSFVHPEAQIDPSVEIGPFCTIGPHVKIGARTRLMSHIVLDGWTEIGEENEIFPFCVLGAIPQDLKYRGEATHLIIGNKNTIRESVTMNLGTVQGGGVTRVGNDCLIMAYTHLGHDCIIGNHCIIANYGGLAGHVVVEDHAILGGMVGVSQFVRVGAYAYVGGSSSLERDVPPFCLAIGTRPTAIKGANIVGLRRRGFSAESVQKINEAVKLWVRPDIQKEPCLVEIQERFGDSPEVMSLVEFIRKSEVGVAR